MEQTMTWADRVRAYRNRRGLSQQRLASELECSIATVKGWESRQFPPSGPGAEALRDRFEGLEAEAQGGPNT